MACGSGSVLKSLFDIGYEVRVTEDAVKFSYGRKIVVEARTR